VPGLVVVEQVLSVANEAALWRFDTATYAAHLGLPDQDASTNGGTPLHEEVLLNVVPTQKLLPPVTMA
jgi:hypothetical protein